jgi:hypothetical protein
MEHNESEHGDMPFYVHKRVYDKTDFPTAELLSCEFQDFIKSNDYQGSSHEPYLASAFNSAAQYGLDIGYLMGNDNLYVDIHPEYYPEVINVLKNNETEHHYWYSVENDLVLKRFALQLDIHSGEWAEAFQYATQTSDDKNGDLPLTSKDSTLAYYLVSTLLKVLTYVEKRDNVELVNKHGRISYHLGYVNHESYSPKRFGIILRALSLSNRSSIPVLGSDHMGRVHPKNCIAVFDAMNRIEAISNALNNVYDYKVYSDWLDAPISDTAVMVNNILTIFNPSGHELQVESGEVNRMVDFINHYGFEKAILAVHNHGYSLEALSEFEGMPKSWVKNIVHEYPYDYQGMLEIIRGS